MTKNKPRVNKPCILTIAGSDSSGGAGVQADIKAIAATGGYGASVITALTAQNTLGVQAIFPVTPEFIAQQLDSIFTDLNIAAVKIGMLHNEQIIKVVASILQKFKVKNIVLDPVMVSKNNYPLIELDTIQILKDTLFSLATLITPNLPETELLLSKNVNTPAEQKSAAIQIGQQFKTNILVKGGHFNNPQASDVLYLKTEDQCYWFHADRIDTINTHGTGCTLSAAIASYLAQDYSLNNAIAMAKKYLTNAITFGASFSIGHGCGPVDHFYFLESSI